MGRDEKRGQEEQQEKLEGDDAQDSVAHKLLHMTKRIPEKGSKQHRT